MRLLVSRPGISCFRLTRRLAYFIESLPDIPQDLLSEMYSGLIPIDMNNASRALFYVFQPTIGEPVDEVHTFCLHPV